jgi:hypothetical protein
MLQLQLPDDAETFVARVDENEEPPFVERSMLTLFTFEEVHVIFLEVPAHQLSPPFGEVRAISVGVVTVMV